LAKSGLPVQTGLQSSAGHYIARGLLAMLLGVVVTGCAAYWRSHTQGTSGPVTWHVAGAKSESQQAEDRYTYSFVLVLQETQGTAITFTTMTYTIDGGTGVRPGANEWSSQGQWTLPPRGTYRFPLRYTILCPQLSECFKLHHPAPAYHIVLTGTDNQKKSVRVVIDLKLPPDPDAVPKYSGHPAGSAVASFTASSQQEGHRH
jgi:hypothetical protein